MPTTSSRYAGPSASQTVFPLLCRSCGNPRRPQQQAETGEIREQHAVDEEAGQSLTTIGVLPILLAQATTLRWFRRSFSRRELFLPTAFGDRVKEVHPAEVFWTFQRVGQSLIGMVEVLDASTVFGRTFCRFLPVRLFSLLGFRQPLLPHIHAVKPGVVERWVDCGDHAASFRPSILPRSSCLFSSFAARSCRGLTTCR